MSSGASATMEDVIAHSFRDYHVKGFDYICIGRSPALTTKLYFFEGDVSKLPEVVNPHDHRYDFSTFVLSGKVTNRHFLPSPSGMAGSKLYNRFRYRTPLNGGSGFEWVGQESLYESSPHTVGEGGKYRMNAEDYHTIKIHSDSTVLMLQQFADKVPLDQPTSTFTLDREPPSLSGLYSKFTPDQVRKRLADLERFAGISIPVA
jgi:hypothetical protein